MAERVHIGSAGDFVLGESKTVKANDKVLVVVRTENGICALINRCSHLPLPIAGGKVEGNTITCPWHNSKFDICTGNNLDWVSGVSGVKMPDWVRKVMSMGKKPQSIQTYDVIEEDGEVYVAV